MHLVADGPDLVSPAGSEHRARNHAVVHHQRHRALVTVETPGQRIAPGGRGRTLDDHCEPDVFEQVQSKHGQFGPAGGAHAGDLEMVQIHAHEALARRARAGLAQGCRGGRSLVDRQEQVAGDGLCALRFDARGEAGDETRNGGDEYDVSPESVERAAPVGPSCEPADVRARRSGSEPLVDDQFAAGLDQLESRLYRPLLLQAGAIVGPVVAIVRFLGS